MRIVFKTIILEDEADAMAMMKSFLDRYSKESGQTFEVLAYDNAAKMLESYDATADIVFTDIQMAGIDGMSAAKKIRERDKEVLIIFVTNLAQYAIEGYEVKAFDFILKPIRYTSFSMKLNRAIKDLQHKRNDVNLNINTKDGIRRIAVSDIIYAEVRNHDTVLHTANGDIKMRITLSKLAKELEEHHFSLCNACYLVNLRYVNQIDIDNVILGNNRLRISQSKRKAFLSEVAKYCGGSE